MRHTTLLLSSLIASATVAQDYLANEPIWNVRSICGVPAPCISTDNYNYITAGDSLIMGVTWSKVIRQGWYMLNWQSPNTPDPNCQGSYQYGPALHGVKLIRQEGRQLRIWTFEEDQLLHDFDLMVGSIVPQTYTNWGTNITVIAVDSVLIGTEMRARYELGNSWAQYLIEGVGSSHGLFEPLTDFFDCGYSLECFGLGSVAFYPEVGASCSLIMGLGDAIVPTPWTLAPNPADNVVAITTNAVAAQDVIIRDVRGRMVIQERLAAMPKASLDVSRLPNGCYAVSIGALPPQRLVVAR